MGSYVLILKPSGSLLLCSGRPRCKQAAEAERPICSTQSCWGLSLTDRAGIKEG